MFRTTRSQIVALVFVLVIFAVIALSTAGRDATFKKNAALTVATISVADPTAVCNPREVLASPNGYYAKCVATGVGGSSQVYSVTVTFYPSVADAQAESSRRLGRAWLVFEKPRHLTNVTFQREGGTIFD